MNEPLAVLGVFAHPDDAELLCGGALARSADAGERTGVLDLTRGELGTRGTAEIRAREAEAAATILGLAVRRNAELPDGHLQNDLPSRARVAGLIRELRPRVVVTHWTQGRHPDHHVAAQLTYDACFLAGLRNFDAPGDAHRPTAFLHATAFREDADPPSIVIDVTAHLQRKLDALAAYASQFEGLSQAGEVFPGGDRPLVAQIEAHLARYGSLIRVRYGEPFRSRDTLPWDTLGSIPTISF
jgi:bacillithiol biosynthesis deacetylase BshB1